MTKDELRKEAEELYKDWYAHKIGAISIIDVICKMAEPREKRIEELEQLIKTQDRKLRQQSKECDKAINMVEIHTKKIVELKEQLLEQKQYTAFKCNEAVKEKEVYEREHYLLTTAKEIIKKLRALYLSPVVTKDDVKKQDEILNEAEQFINEVEK